MSILLLASLLRSLPICSLGLLSNLVPNLLLNLAACLQVFSSASLFFCLFFCLLFCLRLFYPPFCLPSRLHVCSSSCLQLFLPSLLKYLSYSLFHSLFWRLACSKELFKPIFFKNAC